MPRAKKTRRRRPLKPQGCKTEVVQIGADPESAARLSPRLEPSPPFLLAYHPARWTVMGGRCVPALARLALMAGVDGITRGAGGRPMWRETAARWRERGWTVIPHSAGPDGSYLRRVGVRGGYAHLTAWEVAHSGTSYVDTDTQGYADWIDGMFSGGTLPAPQVWALEALRDRTQRSMMALGDKALTIPSMQARVTRQSTDLKAIEARIAELGVIAVAVDSDAVVID